MPDFITIVGFLSGFYLIDPGLEAESVAPTLILVHLLDGVLCAIIARHSGRNPRTWGLLGLTVGVWAVLPLLLLPALRRDNGTTGQRDHEATKRPHDTATTRPQDPE